MHLYIFSLDIYFVYKMYKKHCLFIKPNFFIKARNYTANFAVLILTLVVLQIKINILSIYKIKKCYHKI